MREREDLQIKLNRRCEKVFRHTACESEKEKTVKDSERQKTERGREGERERYRER